MQKTSATVPTEFQSDRLIMKKLLAEMAEPLVTAVQSSHQSLEPFLPWANAAFDLDAAQSMAARNNTAWRAGDGFSFLVFQKETNELLGGCGINRFEPSPVVNVGYWLKNSATGQGFAVEILKALTNMCLKQAGFIRAEVIMAVDNPKSRRVAQAAGAHYEGIAKSKLYMNNKVSDAYVYSVTSPLD